MEEIGILSTVILLLIYATANANSKLEGWNYESQNPIEMAQHDVVAIGDTIFSLGSQSNGEYFPGNDFFTRVWMFSTKTMEWSWRESTGEIPERRNSYCLVAIKNKVHLFGGQIVDGFAYTNDIYSLDTNEFEWRISYVRSATKPSKRGYSRCVAFQNRLYIYGGFDSYEKIDLWFYDFDTLMWKIVDTKQKFETETPIVSRTQMSIYKDVLVVFSGLAEGGYLQQHIWRFNITSERWLPSRYVSGISARYAGTSGVVGTRFYVFGGDTGRAYLNDVSYFDLESNQAGTIIPSKDVTFPIQTPVRRSDTASAVVGDKLYVVGGVENALYNDVWVFHPESKAWVDSTISRIPIGRFNPMVTALNKTHIVMFGGYMSLNFAETPINDLWTFDTVSKRWTRLWQEGSCSPQQMICIPAVTDAAIGAYDGNVYVIGRLDRGFQPNPIQRRFSIEKREWSAINTNNQLLSVVSALRSLVYGMVGSRLFMFGGTNASGNNNPSIFIFDMKDESIKQANSQTQAPQPRIGTSGSSVGATGYEMNDQFCFMDTDSYSKSAFLREIWCFEEEFGWQKVGPVSSDVRPSAIVIGHHVSTFVFGGIREDNRRSNLFMIHDSQNLVWSVIGNQERAMPGRYLGRSVIMDGVVYIVGGLAETSFTNTIYSLDLARLQRPDRQTVSFRDGVLVDGSAIYLYFPGSSRTWDVQETSFIVVSFMNVAQGASVELRVERDCDPPMVVNGKTYRQIDLVALAVGSAVHIPGGQSVVEFLVDRQAQAGEGFELKLFGCSKGFSADLQGCYCEVNRFINFRGDCFTCSGDTHQPKRNQTTCIPKAAISATKQVTRAQKTMMVRSQMEELSQGLDAVVYGSACVIGNRFVAVGGSFSQREDLEELYTSMSKGFSRSVAAESVWTTETFWGDIPSARIFSCFVGVSNSGVLIGGRTRESDPWVYVLDVEKNEWRRMKSKIQVAGAVCDAKGSDVFVYSGQDEAGLVTNRMLKYATEQDVVTVLSLSGSPLAVSFAGGGIVGLHFVVFGGFDGEEESGVMQRLDLENLRAEPESEIKLEDCVKCDGEDNTCILDRQRFGWGIVGTDIHVFGGMRDGETLADLIIINTETGNVTHRLNYGLENPQLPLGHPGPKRGSSSVVWGNSVLIFGGAGNNGLATNDEWTWDAELQTWTDTSIIRQPIQRSGASVCDSGRDGVYVFGGATQYIEEVLLNDIWHFDFETSKWTLVARETSSDGPSGRADATISLWNQSIYVVGGRAGTSSEMDGTIWRFDLNIQNSTEGSSRWTAIRLQSSMSRYQRPLERVGLSVVAVEDSFWVWGGQIPAGTGRVEFYSASFSINTAESRLQTEKIGRVIPTRRKYHRACKIGNKRIVLHGGLDFSGRELRDSWQHDIETQEWIPINYQGMDDSVASSLASDAFLFCGDSTSIGLGVEGSTQKLGGFLMQHEHKVQGRLHISNHLLGYEGITEFGGMSISGISVMFGGQSSNVLSNKIIAYRPGFCSNNRVSLQSGLAATAFDDGSGDARYLADTNCEWALETATHIIIEQRLGKGDRVDVLDMSTLSVLTPSQVHVNGNGTEIRMFSGRGFVVRMISENASQNSQNDENGGCAECEGFVATHAACPERSALDLDSKECLCVEGLKLVGGTCISESVPAAQSGEQSSVVGIAVGGGLGFVVFVGSILGIIYRRRMLKSLKDAEAKLFGAISLKDLKFMELLGRGSFGEVYKGEWRGAEVAIKKISGEISTKELVNFEAEINIMVELRHPNIVLFMGACFEKDNVCLAFELMQQGTLYDVLHNDNLKLAYVMRLRFMQDIAKGMQYLHSANPPILHRDLKSMNVLVDDRFHLKVSDFGMTALKGSIEAQNRNVGTLLWLAPEVFWGKTFEPCADVYSFGIVMWEILTRKDPYDDVQELANIHFLIFNQHRRPTLPPDLPDELEQIIKEAWNTNPEKRPTFKQITTRLSGFLESSSSMSHNTFARAMDHDTAPPDGFVGIVSTRVYNASALWEDMPEEMADAVAAHNDMARKICEKCRGYLSQNDGDGFLVVFQRVCDAVRYCASLQQALDEHVWPSSLLSHECAQPLLQNTMRGLRVQMGIHFGSCETRRQANNEHIYYTGKEVSIAMRLGRLAQGGQIVMSEEAQKEVDDEEYKAALGDCVSEVRLLSRSSSDSREDLLYEVVPCKLEQRAHLMSGITSDQPNITISAEVEMSESIGSHPHSTHLEAPAIEKSMPMKRVKEIRKASKGALPPLGDATNGESRALRAKLPWEIEADEVQVKDERTLGAGSYGSVCVGIYQGQKVAIKKLHVQCLRDNYFLSFYAEVCIMKKIKHRNIVRFIGAMMQIPNLGLVMELVEKGSLRDVLRSSLQPLSAPQKLRLTQGIVRGMSYLHSQTPPILHRDLKSANILVTDDYDAKICDFGFARVKVSNRTMTKCGTIAYQAPELLQGRRYNEKADVYSFGIVLWEMEARESPYRDFDIATLISDVIAGVRPSVSDEMNSDCVALMRRCWDSNSELRPSFGDLLQQLCGNDDFVEEF
eukprot:TRINITY_DN207_c1_g2_i1.p1 TRINITY_DN207_c1_g2~~TRINITY_DN207_c1_g2_i1.p1  ORF type:complete len:2529 (-),score=565.37 TRINITY_DN207_c1_g2_i1:198-7784(-)